MFKKKESTIFESSSWKENAPVQIVIGCEDFMQEVAIMVKVMVCPKVFRDNVIKHLNGKCYRAIAKILNVRVSTIGLRSTHSSWNHN